MSSIDSVLNKAKKLVTPSIKESARFDAVVSEVSSKLISAFTNSGVNVEIAVGGSFSRDTWLPGAHDADLFIRFFDEDDMKYFSKIITSTFPRAIKIKGSRDYFKLNYKNFEFEFLPVLKIDTSLEAKNSMDASYFHIDFVKSNLAKGLNTEVRLLKAFCKALNIYGAESFVSGFSGYVLELLIIYFKSFKNTLRNFSKLKPKIFIDINNYYASKSSAFKALGTKADCPLIVVDPVNPLRNASRSVSLESLSTFILGARRFLANPNISFFKPPQITKESLIKLAKARGNAIFFKKFKPSPRRDAFFSKLQSELKKIAKTLESCDFTVFNYGFLDSGLVYFEITNPILPKSKRVIGPPVFIDDKNFNKFLSKKRNIIYGPYIKGDRICFDIKREITNVKPLLNKLLNEIKI